jgi:hypothetical protein
MGMKHHGWPKILCHASREDRRFPSILEAGDSKAGHVPSRVAVYCVSWSSSNIDLISVFSAFSPVKMISSERHLLANNARMTFFRFSLANRQLILFGFHFSPEQSRP